MSDPLMIYPSGFAGSSIVPLTQGRSPEQIARSLMNRQVNINTKEFPASEQVRELYETLQTGGLTQNSSEFAERTIKLALDLFKRTSDQEGWHGWLLRQHESGRMSINHRNWFDETIGLIVEHKPRRIRAATWNHLLKADDDDRIEHPISPYVANIIEAQYTSKNNLTDWVWHWCMAPSGVYDLAQSLQVIYGPR